MSAEEELKRIFQGMLIDAGERLGRVSVKLSAQNASHFELEEAALRLRNALELIAFSAIAPNKHEYERMRSKAEQAADFAKDFHAKRICQDLAQVNPYFSRWRWRPRKGNLTAGGILSGGSLTPSRETNLRKFMTGLVACSMPKIHGDNKQAMMKCKS